MRDDTAIVSITSGSPSPHMGLGLRSSPTGSSEAPAQLLHPATRSHPNAHLTLLGKMGKCLIAHLVHRLLWVLVFSVSDMLICLFQTEYSQKAGLAIPYSITNKWKKRRMQQRLLFLCASESVTLFNTKGRAAAAGPWSFTFINEVLSIGCAWHCAQLSRYRGQTDK